MASVCIRTSSGGVVNSTYHSKTDSLAYHKKTLAKLDLNREVSDATRPVKQRQKNKSGAASSTKKRVRFQKKEEHTVVFVPRWRDLPVDQAAEIWWTQDALDDLKRDWKYVVYRIDQGETLEDGAGRGLEQHTEEGAWEYYSAQRTAMNAVLEEQDSRGSSIEEIAEAYTSETAKYVQKAIERALQDAKEAKEVRLRRAEALYLLKEACKVKTKHNKKKKSKSRERSKSPSKTSKKQTLPKSSITGAKSTRLPNRHL